MKLKNDNVGLLVGTLFGSIIGSTGTILVLKKLKKLEVKHNLEEEAKHIDEIKTYYENKIEEIKGGVINAPKCIEAATKSIERSEEKAIENKKPERITYDGLLIDNTPEVNKPSFDYSKISRDRYAELQKEYEREEIQEEVDELPHQITKDNYEHGLGFKKLELIYYEQNGIFTYTDDTICNNVTEDIIGADNLSLFGTDDASIDGMSGMYDLYLRSSKIMTDFHLIYNGTEDYYKVVQGR